MNQTGSDNGAAPGAATGYEEEIHKESMRYQVHGQISSLGSTPNSELTRDTPWWKYFLAVDPADPMSAFVRFLQHRGVPIPDTLEDAVNKVKGPDGFVEWAATLPLPGMTLDELINFVGGAGTAAVRVCFDGLVNGARKMMGFGTGVSPASSGDPSAPPATPPVRNGLLPGVQT